MKLPLSLHRYFWDVNPETIDVEKHANYVIERLLEYGDGDAVKWMTASYPANDIIHVLQHSRSLSSKSANFWALIFNVPKSEILCFSKPFRILSRAIWNR